MRIPSNNAKGKEQEDRNRPSKSETIMQGIEMKRL